MIIRLWADYACPYCYIGLKNLSDALKETGSDLEVKLMAFELDPGASMDYTGPTKERLMEKYGISAEEAEESMAKTREMGISSGIEINNEKTRYTNTFKAHRLTEFAYKELENRKYLEFALSLYRGYHTEGKELSDGKYLLDAAINAGLDKEKTLRVLESDDFSKEVRKDEEKASLHGIRGVPYFIIGDFTVPGAVPSEYLKSVLDRYSKK